MSEKQECYITLKALELLEELGHPEPNQQQIEAVEKLLLLATQKSKACMTGIKSLASSKNYFCWLIQRYLNETQNYFLANRAISDKGENKPDRACV